MYWAERLYRDGLGLVEGERTLLVVDRDLVGLGQELDQVARALGALPEMLVVEPPGTPIRTVPGDMQQMIGAADLILTLYSRFDLTHPDALMAAVAAHREGRWAYGAGVGRAILEAAYAQPLDRVVKAATWWGERLSRAKRVRIRTGNGTDLTLRRGGATVHVETGRLSPGGVANVPGGEAYFAPEPGSVTGWLIVDGALGDLPVDEPVTFRFWRGRLVEWWGGGRALHSLVYRFAAISTLGETAVCEFGVGANPYLPRTGIASVDEKRAGTVHLALTDPSGRLHYDAVLEGAQIWLDGKEQPNPF
jgi:leucyl aminopeptidase (aminopeptidase T)